MTPPIVPMYNFSLTASNEVTTLCCAVGEDENTLQIVERERERERERVCE